MDKFFTVKQVAEKLNLSPECVYKYLQSGKLKSLMFGKMHMISQESIDGFVVVRKRVGRPYKYQNLGE